MPFIYCRRLIVLLPSTSASPYLGFPRRVSLSVSTAFTTDIKLGRRPLVGLVVREVGEALRVHHVLPGSPAWFAAQGVQRIRPGDWIVTVGTRVVVSIREFKQQTVAAWNNRQALRVGIIRIG